MCLESCVCVCVYVDVDVDVGEGRLIKAIPKDRHRGRPAEQLTDKTTRQKQWKEKENNSIFSRAYIQ